MVMTLIWIRIKIRIKNKFFCGAFRTHTLFKYAVKFEWQHLTYDKYHSHEWECSDDETYVKPRVLSPESQAKLDSQFIERYNMYLHVLKVKSYINFSR